VHLAYLITAHHQPEHLLRLIDRLDCDGTTFFIHIDRKSDASPFEDLLANRTNVRFVTDRVEANWMGFSLVEVSLKLLALAVKEGFDYCLQLSGSDYPIKTNDYLFSFYERTNKEFITFWDLHDRPSWLHKVSYYYFIDAIPIRDWSNGREKVYWRRLFWGRFFKYQKFMPKRRFLKNMVPYGGSDWWSFSHECASYILDFVHQNPEYLRFYKHTHAPCEMFFQTIILNSNLAPRVENYEKYQKWSADRQAEKPQTDGPMIPEGTFNYRYVDWSGAKSGEREIPAVLDERDWQSLRDSECHFARKFDTQKSSKLLERIDREILYAAN